MLRKNKYSLIFLAAIFLLALLLRTVMLSSFPVGFQIDEASLGYNAYSLLQTGKSEAGVSLPLYIDTFGDNRPTGYNYLAIPPVAIFGLTVFATRLPGAVFGALSVFAIFLLALTLCKDKKIALLSALLLAVSPWGVVLSRASAETVIALFLILIGFFFVIDSIEKKNPMGLVAGVISLALSFFFYHTPRVFVPMFFFVLITVLYFPFKKIARNKSFIKLGIAFAVLCMVSALLIFVVKGGTGRFSQVNIFGFPETRLIMEEQIREDGTLQTPVLVSRAFHNKLVSYSLTFISNYFVYFSGDFLFMHGGKPIWYQVHEMGLLLLVESPFVIYGIYVLAKSRNRLSKLPLFWILVAPVTASITVDDIPNLQRAIVLFPMLEIIAAVGAIKMWENTAGIKQRILSIKFTYALYGLISFIFVFNVGYFLHQYVTHGETHRTWYRNNGFSEMMSIVNDQYIEYDKIVMTKSGGGYPLVLFYSGYSPSLYQKEGSPRDADYKGFGKYIFVPNDCPSINSSMNLPIGTKVLFVDKGTCEAPPSKSGKKYTDIRREDGTLGFRVVY